VEEGEQDPRADSHMWRIRARARLKNTFSLYQSAGLEF
jgi:hypothetical protein